MLVDGVVQLAARSPAVGVVVAYDVVLEGSEELGRGRAVVVGNAVVARSDEARRVVGMTDAYQLTCHLSAYLVGLVVDLVADAPDDH